MRRAVPEIRFRVASSVIATVSDIPGNKITSDATVTSDGVIPVHTADAMPAVNAANVAPRSSSTRA